MCDETTERDNARLLDRRRVLAGASAATLLAGFTPSAWAGSATVPTRSRRVTFATPDGQADGYFVVPTEGKHPAVLLWPDIAGLRPAFETMAARLATEGYAVLAVNPYYRSSASPVLAHFADWRTEAGRARIGPMKAKLTPEAVASDAVAMLAWLDAQPEVDTARKAGTQGYCMSGPFAFRTAAASDRIGAFASFHGGGLVTDEKSSPHRLLGQTQAAALVCIAQNDHERSPDAKGALEAAAKKSGTPAEVTVYPANHGWCALDSPVYDQATAEAAWARLLAVYAERLV
jgi:carboxymethylenebutenolidase